MNLLRVITQFWNDILTDLMIGMTQVIFYALLLELTTTAILNRHDKTDLSARIRGNHRVRIAHGGIQGSRIIHHLANEREMEPLTFSLFIKHTLSPHLRANDASFAQSGFHCVVERVGVQALGRT